MIVFHVSPGTLPCSVLGKPWRLWLCSAWPPCASCSSAGRGHSWQEMGMSLGVLDFNEVWGGTLSGFSAHLLIIAIPVLFCSVDFFHSSDRVHCKGWTLECVVWGISLFYICVNKVSRSMHEMLFWRDSEWVIILNSVCSQSPFLYLNFLVGITWWEHGEDAASVQVTLYSTFETLVSWRYLRCKSLLAADHGSRHGSGVGFPPQTLLGSLWRTLSWFCRERVSLGSWICYLGSVVWGKTEAQL